MLSPLTITSMEDLAVEMKRLIADALPARRSWTTRRNRGSARASDATISVVRSVQPLATTITSSSSADVDSCPRIAWIALAMFPSSLYAMMPTVYCNRGASEFSSFWRFGPVSARDAPSTRGSNVIPTACFAFPRVGPAVRPSSHIQEARYSRGLPRFSAHADRGRPLCVRMGGLVDIVGEHGRRRGGSLDVS